MSRAATISLAAAGAIAVAALALSGDSKQIAQGPVQTAPKVERVEVEPLPPLPKPKPRVIEKQKPKPKPKTPMKLTARPAYCSDLDSGISVVGKFGVRAEARRRGKTEAEIAAAEQACGY